MKLKGLLAFLALYSVAIFQTSAQTPIRGYADIHNHQFSNLAFGQRVCVGEPYGPIDKALPHCSWAHGLGGVLDNADKIRAHRLGHLVGGYPQFDGWPRHNSYTHQSVYQDWLKRAHKGGLQLMVMLAVNNEGLCQLQGPKNLDYSLCNDMKTVDLQIQGARDMEKYIAEKDGGWYKIVYSPEEARMAISQGKLAVILGVEVDFLFGCKNENDCAQEYIKEQLDILYNKGIRQIIPIHLFDNAFGGSAIYSDVNAIMGPNFSHISKKEDANYQRMVNTKGMTETGKFFMKEIMKKGMILDIDHMSALTKTSVFEISKKHSYPLIASHTGFLDQHSHGNIKRHEYNLNDTEIQKIKESQGLCAPILMLHENLSPTLPYSGEENCKGSAEAFVEAYRYAFNRLGPFQIAMGSDFNSGAGLPKPRYGQDGCYSNDQKMVTYPFTSKVNGVVLDRCVSGDRTFDINVDGLSHIGLLPDFMEELSKIGLTEAELEPLYHSAENYVRVWEKSEQAAIPMYSLGKENHARTFTNAEDDVKIEPYKLDNLWEFTIEAWIKPTYDNGLQSIISSTGLDYIHLQIGNGGNNVVYTSDGGTIMLPIIPTYPLNVWRHVAIVVRSGDTRLYIDGKLVGTPNTNTFQFVKRPSTVHIGKGYANGRHFNGQIADLRIWSWALEDELIKNAMAGNVTYNSQGLSHFYFSNY